MIITETNNIRLKHDGALYTVERGSETLISTNRFDLAIDVFLELSGLSTLLD